MKNYYVVEIKGGDEFDLLKTDNICDAITEARFEGKRTKGEIEVRTYEDDVEDEDCENFNYDTIEWDGAEGLATLIKNDPSWNANFCFEFVELAGMTDEYIKADETESEAIMERAAEKLGVEIW